MCGIAGSIGRDRLDAGRIERTLDSLRQRGPDARGVFQQEVGDKTVNLLHTRLAIIDLNARANQPFVRNGMALIFNGEIYNYLEIADELRASGTVLTTGSDTEVLLEAYCHWGLACLDRFEGMWAFALLDVAKEKLILCRDRFGEKPLFMLERAGSIYFASEPKALAALRGVPLEVNAHHIRRYLVNGYRSLFKGAQTFYEAVREVPPATAIIFNVDNKGEEKRYWDLRPEPQPIAAEEAVAGVRERLRHSVKLRLRSDVPLAFCLSGGVDSTALATIAARELGTSVHAFSVIDNDERYDESENISMTVRALGCDHFVARTSTDGFFERMADLVAYHNAPVPTISYYLHSFLSDAVAERGYKVAVSGTGADELFTGYYDHYAFWLSEYAGTPEFEDKLAEWRATYGRWVNNPLLKDPLLFNREPGFRGHLYQSRDIFNRFLVEPIDEEFTEVHFSNNLLRNRMMNELNHESVPVMLRADDMNSMRVSVENRSPYLDRDLAEFAAQLPNDILIRDGLAKWPLRQAVKDIAPEPILSASRKRGFNASIDSVVDRSNPETRERLLSPGPIFDLVNRGAIEAFLNEDMSDNSLSKFLFSFVSAKLFLEAATQSTTSVGEPAGMAAQLQ